MTQVKMWLNQHQVRVLFTCDSSQLQVQVILVKYSSQVKSTKNVTQVDTSPSQ